MQTLLYGLFCIMLGLCSYWDRDSNPNVFWYWMIMATIWFASKD